MKLIAPGEDFPAEVFCPLVTVLPNTTTTLAMPLQFSWPTPSMRKIDFQIVQRPPRSLRPLCQVQDTLSSLVERMPNLRIRLSTLIPKNCFLVVTRIALHNNATAIRSSHGFPHPSKTAVGSKTYALDCESMCNCLSLNVSKSLFAGCWDRSGPTSVSIASAESCHNLFRCTFRGH